MSFSTDSLRFWIVIFHEIVDLGSSKEMGKRDLATIFEMEKKNGTYFLFSDCLGGYSIADV